MTTFLIEFRFQGRVKSLIKKITHNVNSKFNIKAKKSIPHITLVRPFRCRDEKKLIGVLNHTCSKYPLIEFRVNGYNSFPKTRVIYVDIAPSKELDELSLELVNNLRMFCSLDSSDFYG